MLVVDLLHEFELGVWKALFTHLIRILHAAASHGGLVTELDRRCVNCSVSYRELINQPGFGPCRRLAQARSGVLERMPQR